MEKKFNKIANNLLGYEKKKSYDEIHYTPVIQP